MKLIQEKASHWYTGSGKPLHEVPKKDGKGMKAVTVKEARELHLLPSVTNVLGVCNKPQLNDWRVEQAIKAALTLPRLRESFDDWMVRIPPMMARKDLLTWVYCNPAGFAETEDAFARRVVQDADAQRDQAADFGSRIHAAIATELTDPGAECPPDLEPYMAHWRQWAMAEIEEVISCEQIVVSADYGYAGRMDLDCRMRGIGRAVVDFKSRRVRNGKPEYYPEDGLQLSAYSFARFVDHNEEVPALVSVIIDSGTPSPVHVKVWENPYGLFKIFQHVLEIWKHFKNYNPCEQRNDGQLLAK